MLALAIALACSAPPEVPVPPSHASVREAVADDAELSDWTATPDGYVLRRAERPELAHHALWFLVPGDVSHPVSVYVAQGPAGVLVTTGRPDAVWRVVSQEPGLAASDALPVVVHELLRDHGRQQQVIDGTASVQGGDGAWTVAFGVEDAASGRTRWTVRLAERGSRVEETAE